MDADAAQAWFVAGTIPLLVAGGLHALLTLVDAVRPTHFAPIDGSVQTAMAGSGMRFGRRFGGSGATMTMWDAWLGFNISHGLGAFTFGLLCLLIGANDFELVERVDAIRALTIAVPVIYVVVALRFWFYGPLIITAASTACFTIAALLSA
jgi:hypothetical protein